MVETVGALIIESLVAESFVAAGGWAVTVAPSTLFGLGATAVGSAALIGGALIAGAAVAKSLPSAVDVAIPRPSSDGTQTLKQAIPPRLFGYGRARISGAYMLYEATLAAQTEYGYSVDIIALHHGKLANFRHWYLNNDLVTLNSSTGAVTSAIDPRTSNVYADIRYASQVTIKQRLGADPETAHTTAPTWFPSLWTSAHRGDGIASAELYCTGVTLQNYSAVFPHGLPRLSVVADCTPVYDPRDPLQSQGDATTWLPSRNPVLQLLDYLTSTHHGLGQSWSEMITPVLSDLMVQADYCDDLVRRNDGVYEPRYASSGFAYMTTDPVDVITAILATCDGWMAEDASGRLALWIGKYQAPTVTLTDDHIYGFTIEKGVRDEELVNEIRFNYTPPANDYREAEGEPWRDEAGISEAGRVRSQSMSLTWVHSHTQARRLAKRAMARYAATMRGSMTVSLYGLKLLGQRWVAIQSDAIADFANVVVEVSRVRIDLGNQRVTFDWVLVNPNEVDAWDYATEGGTEPNYFYQTAITSAPSGLALADAGGHKIRVTLSAWANPGLRLVLGCDPSGPSSEVFTDHTDPYGSAQTITIVLSPGAAGTYAVRAAYRNLDGSVGTYSAPVSITIA